MDGFLTFLIVSLVVAAVCQRDPSRRKAALLFVVAIGLHDVVAGGFDGLLYYFSAAGLDLLVIAALAAVPRSALRLQLMQLSLLSIALNAIGFVLWFLYLAPTLYNISFLGLYALALIAMLKGTGTYVGFNAFNRRRAGVSSPCRARVLHHKDQRS